MDLNEFYDELEKFDWFYEMSDDHNVWRRGQKEYNKLNNIACKSPEHGKLFSQYKKHVFSGESWMTSKQPKPDRPEV